MKLVDADRAEARDWMEQSLSEGHHVSSAVLETGVLDEGRFLVVVPDDFERSSLDFAVGGVTKMRPAEEALGRFLDEECQRGARCVVIEDEFMASGDPAVDRSRETLAFIHGRVVRWCDLRSGGLACADAIHRGSSGFPLNAFVTRREPSELRLEDRKEMGISCRRRSSMTWSRCWPLPSMRSPSCFGSRTASSGAIPGMRRNEGPSGHVLIEGEFYQGAFGPTLRLHALSRDAVERLRDVFMGLAETTSADIDIAKLSDVRLREVRELTLR